MWAVLFYPSHIYPLWKNNEYNAEIRTSRSRFSSQIKIYYFRADKLEIDFDIHKTRFWTDSKIALGLIKNSSKSFLVYIVNCLHKKLNSNINEWCFIPEKKITLGSV